ncbi:MAG: cytochrome [Mycobacterium sp.]|jgi:hypothetical protein|nr:cytochrome [Mycobacterium sp.]
MAACGHFRVRRWAVLIGRERAFPCPPVGIFSCPPTPNLAFLPFGAGPHRCFGASMGSLQAQFLLALIHQRFRTQSAPGWNHQHDPGLPWRGNRSPGCRTVGRPARGYQSGWWSAVSRRVHRGRTRFSERCANPSSQRRRYLAGQSGRLTATVARLFASRRRAKMQRVPSVAVWPARNVPVGAVRRGGAWNLRGVVARSGATRTSAREARRSTAS